MSPMYGEDSSGRKVSLLNHEPSATTTTSTIPNRNRASEKSTSTDLSPMSRIDNGLQSSSRYSSSPETNSRTPPLERHGSAASLGSSSSTTSPMTPSYPVDPLDQQKKPSPYYAYSRANPQLYPVLNPASESSVQPYYSLQGQAIPDPELEDPYHINQAPLQPLQTQFGFTDPSLAGLSPASLTAPLLVPTTSQHQPHPPPVTTTVPKSSATTAAVAPKSQIKTSPTDNKNIGVSGSTSAAAGSKPGIKKKFPCPHAARFSCTDTFTTSGHAARHGKKHTGEKSVICPTCNKAFTRKDNMKQHERTHKNNPSRTNDSSSTPKAAATIASSSAGSKAVTKATESTTSTPAPLRKGRLGSLSVLQEEGNGTATSRSATFNFLTTPTLNMNDNKGGDGRLARGVRVGRFSGRSDEDGEGESPGLDALAPAG